MWGPEASSVMAEIGAHIFAQESETLERYLEETLDLVITVCDDANEAYPVSPGARERLQWSFPDPSTATGGYEERLQPFRNVRDEIRARIASWRECDMEAAGALPQCTRQASATPTSLLPA